MADPRQHPNYTKHAAATLKETETWAVLNATVMGFRILKALDEREQVIDLLEKQIEALQADRKELVDMSSRHLIQISEWCSKERV